MKTSDHNILNKIAKDIEKIMDDDLISQVMDGTMRCGKTTMSERAEQIAKDLDLEAKLRFYENWAEAVINGYFVFSDGSEIKVSVK